MKAYAEIEENEKCREMIEDNIAEVDWLGASSAITRRFFLVFQYEPQMKAKRNTVRAIAQRLSEEADTARRYLDVCGLEVLEPRYPGQEPHQAEPDPAPAPQPEARPKEPQDGPEPRFDYDFTGGDGDLGMVEKPVSSVLGEDMPEWG